ncbi:MAG: NAD(P)/FAD-dependent oxidoreductase [Coriobacteriia bacterium]|nr:NAD(P)/FAD-dependent oxidoreductase [Coriobacteriia bacterium]
MDVVKDRQTAVIIGAGPAGLTAAYELQRQVGIKPIIFEGSGEIGGISKTVEFKGNRIDIGGHRFFSKSDWVMRWWANILPIQGSPVSNTFAQYQGSEQKRTGEEGPDPDETDLVLLVRSRLSRIYYGGKFYNYPVTLDAQTIRNLGFMRLAKMGLSYGAIKLKPRREENLEDFYINRFGRELYDTFFRDYTEKVWGVPVRDIAANWGVQRVKGLSIRGAVMHAIKTQLGLKRDDIGQKGVETSLIEYFLYPKLGPGQMWEQVTNLVQQSGGEVWMNHVVTKVHAEPGRILAVDVLDTEAGVTSRVEADHFFSTMSIKDLIAAFEGVEIPDEVCAIAEGLPYRDFITIGILATELRIRGQVGQGSDIVQDNWIYIQEPQVKVGRLQIFNNWSPYMVADETSTWVGMEYFCDEDDAMWSKSDEEMSSFGIAELAEIGILDPDKVLDATVIRVRKTYPAYFGTYVHFDKVREFADSFENLFLIGRNGQHRYNNQDHSMLTAKEAVTNVVTGRRDKENIWNINLEQEYHEEK